VWRVSIEATPRQTEQGVFGHPGAIVPALSRLEGPHRVELISRSLASSIAPDCLLRDPARRCVREISLLSYPES